jgi:phosphatidylglycerol---prolipoprotein diacylglyceryl transferase
MRFAVISIGIDPELHVGPVTIAWHGLMLAIGIGVGLLLAGHEARRRGMSTEPIGAIGAIVAASAFIGGRLWYLAETDPGALVRPADWLDTNGFTFYGGFVMAAIGIAIYVRAKRLDLAFLDVVAAALPLGIAVGRIGDVINGEHYGPQSDWLLAVRNTHPDAMTPNPALAYHSGGLYEVLLGLAVFTIVWPIRRRFARPLMIMWLVIALFGMGRFAEFFARSDSEDIALGLNYAQWSSLVLVGAAVLGAVITLRYATRRQPRGESATRVAAPAGDISSSHDL